LDVFEDEEASSVIETSGIVKVGDRRMEKIGGDPGFANRLLCRCVVGSNDLDKTGSAGRDVASPISFRAVSGCEEIV